MKRILPILAVTALVARLLQLAGLHPLVWDEIEFFRATDWVRQGLVPFRDFWEHHTPLQWFLYAPVAALTRSPGAPAIILMRFAQIPLWIATFVLSMRWMERAGIARWARWSAIVVALTSSLLMLPAVEYRVDALGCFFLVLAMYFVQRMNDGVVYAVLAGSAFCLAGFANLRLGPVLVIAVLLIRILPIDQRKWGGNVRANWLFAGGAATFALGSLYFVATHSVGVAYRSIWTANLVANRYEPAVPGAFLLRLAAQFGIRRIADQIEFDPSGIDLAGIIILVAGLAGVARILVRRWRTPDDRFYLAFLAVVNLLFVAAMKYINNYHFEVVVLTLVPFVAMEIESFVPERVAMSGLAVLLCISTAVAMFRGKEGDTQYQDHIMRAVDRQTAPGTAVWDSAGWALRRKPAYRYWFLRMIVAELEQHGMVERYTGQQLLANPPAAIVADRETRVWMFLHRDLGKAIVSHYLPADTELWLPGMSARLLPGAGVEWVVPANGTYTIYSSARLAKHPWFRQPFYFDAPEWHEPVLIPIRTSDLASEPVVFTVNGAAVPTGARSLTLRRLDRVAAISRAAYPIGIMLPRVTRQELFIFPPPGVTFEGSVPPRWHIPDLSVLAYNDE